MSTHDHERHTLEILRRIHRQTQVSQRGLASQMGIALGLTNLLVRRLVKQGHVRIRRIRSNHLHYVLTPTGVAEMARRAADSLENTLRLYTTTRDLIRRQLGRLEEAFPGGAPRIVLYGSGDVGELVYVSLNRSKLRLVAVIDDKRAGGRFFEHEILQPELFFADGHDFDFVVIATFRKAHLIDRRLRELRVASNRIFSLGESVDYLLGPDSAVQRPERPQAAAQISVADPAISPSERSA
jgi:DNA-binding MarR family transcriptional regulator